MRIIRKGIVTPVLLALIGISPAQAAERPLEKVTLRTDYKLNGYVAPFVLAQDRGFYKESGLDVEVGEGQGSSVTIQTVAAGRDTFGLADATALVIGVSSRNIPVKALAVYSQTDIQGFAYHKDSGWDEKLPSMKGKVIVSSPGSAELSLLPAIFATAGMSVNDVDIRLVDANAKVPLFIQTPNSYLGGYATGDAVRIRSRMPDMGFVPFSRFGINAYGTALIVGTPTLTESPDMVRRFVAASNRGWEETIKDPEAAIQSLAKQFPDANIALLRDGLAIMLKQQMHTPATEGKRIGWMAESDWAAMLRLLQTYSNLQPKATQIYYTNDFVSR